MRTPAAHARPDTSGCFFRSGDAQTVRGMGTPCRTGAGNRPLTGASGDFEGFPATYRRLVGKASGSTFREVARVLVGQSLPDLVASLGEDEVLVRVKYAGVNGGCETFRCRAEYAFSRNKEAIDFPLGAEGVGTVIAAGSPREVVEGHGEIDLVGQPVMFVGGAFSEYVKLKRSACFPVDEELKDYAAVRISGHVAYASLKYTAGLRAGDAVLVTAGAGATGSFAVQVAKHMGCHVVATCRNSMKAETLRNLGADRIIDYSRENVKEALEREYPKQIDVCYEGVGGRLMKDVWDVGLKRGGKLLSVGYISQYPHNDIDVVDEERRQNSSLNLPPSEELFWKGLVVGNSEEYGSKIFYGNVWPADAAVREHALQETVALVQKGAITAVVDPLVFHGVNEVSDAVEYMLTGEAIGKVLVEF
jgi:NADPH:quinone reductase-like Zn-dependent oxidoreductase